MWRLWQEWFAFHCRQTYNYVFCNHHTWCSLSGIQATRLRDLAGYIDSSSLMIYIKVKWYRYRTGVAQRVGRGIALLFHDRGTPRPHFSPGKDTVPILQETGWAPGPVWTGGKSRPHRDSIPDLPARSQSIYWLSYPAHNHLTMLSFMFIIAC